MKVGWIQMDRHRALWAGIGILGIFSAAALLATNFQIHEVSPGNYTETMWPGTAPTITWNENFTSNPANVVVNDSMSAATVLGHAFSEWSTATQPGTSTLATDVHFAFGNASTSLSAGPALDCKNVIGFHDTDSSNFPTGIIAFAIVTSTPEGFVPGSNCPTYTVPCPIPNCIVDSDIMFNPAQTFATAGAVTGQYDLQSVAAHEIGHMLGLDHSNIAHAVMFPYGDTSQIGLHPALLTDDIIGMGHLYPGPGSANGNGIEGKVSLNGTGIFAADVEAIDAATGNVVTETLTDPSGNYTLHLYDGSYYVYVQSLAPSVYSGPTTIVSFRGQAGYGDNNFSNIPANPTNYTGAYY